MKVLEISQRFPVGAMQAVEILSMNSNLSKAHQQDSSELSGRIRDDSRRVLSKQVSRPCNGASKRQYSWLSRRFTVIRKAAKTFTKDGYGCQTTGVKERGMLTQGKLRNLGDPSCSMLTTPDKGIQGYHNPRLYGRPRCPAYTERTKTSITRYSRAREIHSPGDDKRKS